MRWRVFACTQLRSLVVKICLQMRAYPHHLECILHVRSQVYMYIVHVERASAHVVIRISLQMRRLALTCAPTANRVDCTNTSQEPDHRKETQASIMHWRCPPAQLYRCTAPLGNMTQLHWVTTVHHIDHTLISRKQLPQLASC